MPMLESFARTAGSCKFVPMLESFARTAGSYGATR
jgi:hypothetical protein